MNESMLNLPEPQIIEIGMRVRFIIPLREVVPQRNRGETDRVIEQQRLESRLESNLAARVVIFLIEEDSKKSQLAKKLGHKTVSGELHKQIKRLLEMGIIEMTLSDKPSSRLQKYRLTDAGRVTLDMQQFESSQGNSDE